MTNNKHKHNPYKISLSKFSTHNIIQNIIRKQPNGSRILDVGSNDGYVGKDFVNIHDFYGIDYMKETVENCKKIYKDCDLYDLNDLKPLKWRHKYDLIIFADVLEHVIDPATSLKYFVDKYLNDQGMVIISLPNIANWQIRARLMLGKFDYTETGIMDKTHLHLYTYKSAIELIDKCNLMLSKSYGGATIMGPIIKMLPFTKPLLATNIILECERCK